MQTWTELEFEELLFHDVHVHGLSIAEGEHGSGILKLDIDYILEWLCSPNDQYCRFRIAPAELSFREICDLRISIDYAVSEAGICPFSIDGVRRVRRVNSGYVTYQWDIPVNWPSGLISFMSPGFELRTRGRELITESQCLTLEQRSLLNDA